LPNFIYEDQRCRHKDKRLNGYFIGPDLALDFTFTKENGRSSHADVILTCLFIHMCVIQYQEKGSKEAMKI